MLQNQPGALRTTVQLLLIGQVLQILFAGNNPALVGLISLVMLVMAGREVMARQQIRIKGIQGWLLGTGAMFISSFSVTFIALTVIINNSPWYTPQYVKKQAYGWKAHQFTQRNEEGKV
jgi:putative ABC transport system permease protein